MLHGDEGRARCIVVVRCSQGQAALLGQRTRTIARIESWVIDAYIHLGRDRVGSFWDISSCTHTARVRGGTARCTYMMGLHASTLRDSATVRGHPWLGAEASHFTYCILCSSCSLRSHGPNGRSSCACFLAFLHSCLRLFSRSPDSYKYYRVTRQLRERRCSFAWRDALLLVSTSAGHSPACA